MPTFKFNSTLLVLAIFLAFLCESCSQAKEPSNQEKLALENTIDEAEATAQIEAPKEQESQAQLRKRLMDSKPNENLKASILQELYIRGLVKEKGENYSFSLPFDLHTLDCGAPDCYTTEISFEIPAKNPVEFPAKLTFKLFESGCVDKEVSQTGTFELKEDDDDLVNYFSAGFKSNLMITRDGQLYYFPHTKPKSASLQEVQKILEEDLENLKKVPFQSTTMTSNEYELFLPD